MADFPLNPVPASTSVASVMDPMFEFVSDAGYRVRRSRYPRPLRRYTLTYLGLTTDELRQIRSFLIQHRLSITPFTYYSLANYDHALVANTTPIILTFQDPTRSVVRTHEYLTGQWVLLWNSTNGTDGAYQVTYYDAYQVMLNGSYSHGPGETNVRSFIPRAIGTFEEGTMESVKLMGPESTMSDRGRFSMTVQISEIF